MSGLECVGWQDSARENLAWKKSFGSAKYFVGIFKTKLFVDELNLSNEKFKQTVDDFFKYKIIVPPKPPHCNDRFLKPYVLVQFAFKAYKDHKNETLTLNVRHG